MYIGNERLPEISATQKKDSGILLFLLEILQTVVWMWDPELYAQAAFTFKTGKFRN